MPSRTATSATGGLFGAIGQRTIATGRWVANHIQGRWPQVQGFVAGYGDLALAIIGLAALVALVVALFVLLLALVLAGFAFAPAIAMLLVGVGAPPAMVKPLAIMALFFGLGLGFVIYVLRSWWILAIGQRTAGTTPPVVRRSRTMPVRRAGTGLGVLVLLAVVFSFLPVSQWLTPLLALSFLAAMILFAVGSRGLALLALAVGIILVPFVILLGATGNGNASAKEAWSKAAVVVMAAGEGNTSTSSWQRGWAIKNGKVAPGVTLLAKADKSIPYVIVRPNDWCSNNGKQFLPPSMRNGQADDMKAGTVFYVEYATGRVAAVGLNYTSGNKDVDAASVACHSYTRWEPMPSQQIKVNSQGLYRATVGQPWEEK